MQRILIIGSGGAGKSTLARQLSTLLDLPVVHLDRLFWLPGWVNREQHEFDLLIQQAIDSDNWIMDGNYCRTLAVRAERADTVIWLDFPSLLCLFRVLKRRLRYHGRCRPDLTEGCREMVDLEFLKWICTFRKKVKPEMKDILKNLPASKRLIILKSPSQVAGFVDQLRQQLAEQPV